MAKSKLLKAKKRAKRRARYTGERLDMRKGGRVAFQRGGGYEGGGYEDTMETEPSEEEIQEALKNYEETQANENLTEAPVLDTDLVNTNPPVSEEKYEAPPETWSPLEGQPNWEQEGTTKALRPTQEYAGKMAVQGFRWSPSQNTWVSKRNDERLVAARKDLEKARAGAVDPNLVIDDPIKLEGQFQKDADGNNILDENGNPIPVVEDLTTDEFALDKLVKAGLTEDGSYISAADVDQTKVAADQIDLTDPTQFKNAKITDETLNAAKVAGTYTADKIIDTAPTISEAQGTIEDESKALAAAVNVANVGTVDSADVEIPVGALVEKVTGTISDQAMATLTKVSGQSLAKITRAKTQLRKAGLSEEDIQAIGNDPEDLEARLMEFTEEQRGLISGLPKEALVSTQLSTLLDGVESGNIPTWASPAVAAVEQMLAQRGLSASTVGRNDLLNGIISAAIPVANANATAIQASIAQDRSIEANIAIKNAELASARALQNAQNVFNMDMAQFDADQQRAITNSKFFQTIGLTEATFDQESFIKSAVLLSQENLAQADVDQKRAIQHAQAFLGMDMQNLSNKQAARVLEANMSQERLLSNQAAENASLQFNAKSKNETNQFMAALESEVSRFNAEQFNALSKFNVEQENLVNAKNADRTTDINKFNANLQASLEEFNSEQEFARNQFNLANSAAVKQSNVAWRRQINVADTAAQNAVNMQNAQNAFGLSVQAQSFIWQELRDQADFDFRAQENEYTRIAQLVSTAVGSDPERYGNLSGTITDLIKSITG